MLFLRLVFLQFLLKLLAVKEFLPQSYLTRFLANYICVNRNLENLCSNIFFFMVGYNFHSLNESRLPVYFPHTPATTSFKTVVNIKYLAHNDLFREYYFHKVGFNIFTA